MNYWIGVIGSKLAAERFSSNSVTWFCMPKSCDIGDYVLMYASKNAVGVKSGIFSVFQILSKDDSKDAECYKLGNFSGTAERLIYVNLSLVKKFTKPIPFKNIKSNDFLGSFVYVRRNFQATYFPISEKEYKAFVLLESKVD
jgi:predicted RNA-binding protein with PUA-like domain